LRLFYIFYIGFQFWKPLYNKLLRESALLKLLQQGAMKCLVVREVPRVFPYKGRKYVISRSVIASSSHG